MYTTKGTHNGIAKHLKADFKQVKTKARETRAALSKTAKDVRGRAKEVWSSSITDAEDNIVEYVKKNPVKAVGYSILAGAIISLLLRK